MENENGIIHLELKRKPTIIAIIIFVGFFSIFVISMSYSSRVHIEKVSQISYEIDDIAKTLWLAYGKDSVMSPYEAKCYAYMFRDFSEAYNNHWAAYGSVLRVELGYYWDVTQKSSMDAKGGAQLLEKTAKEYAPKIRVKYRKNNTVWNEFRSVPIGLIYLSEGIKEGKRLLAIDSLPDTLNIYSWGFRWYVGGPRHHKKKRKETREYINWYDMRVTLEFEFLSSLYEGVKASRVKGVKLCVAQHAMKMY